LSRSFFFSLRSQPQLASRIKSMSDQHFARATKARGRLAPGSCNGLFSEGFPTGALRGRSCDHRKAPLLLLCYSLTLALLLSCSFLLNNLIRVSQARLRMQLNAIPCRSSSLTPLQLPKNSNLLHFRQAPSLWKPGLSVEKPATPPSLLPIARCSRSPPRPAFHRGRIFTGVYRSGCPILAALFAARVEWKKQPYSAAIVKKRPSPAPRAES
jgi:hypothetical protein